MARDKRMTQTNTTHFDPLGRFSLPDFQQTRPFASFLPGIAGALGIPLWVFYVNRGQAIAGFGVESKDRPIMEFQPANKAYQQTGALGFRTFINLRRGKQTKHYEPFASWHASEVKREMFIGMNEVEIRETHPGLGLETSVLYFIVPAQPFAALARRVSFRNLGSKPLELEILDGLPALVPYGASNAPLKDMSRTLEAWMQVEHHETRIPFYKLRASAGDSAEVSAIEAGNFALAFSADGERLPVLADPTLVFGFDTAFTHPQHFTTLGLDSVLSATQILEGRTPCAFFAAKLTLNPAQTQTVNSLYGMVASFALIEAQAAKFTTNDFFETSLAKARDLAQTITDPIATQSASPLFDAYCRQTFLDNVMRGGWPLILGGKHVYHVYSRKHGDMERDYNYFVLAPEYYSQGNGNYRDVNQNRRADVFFEPRVADFNIRTFASLIQSDGYNPLVVQGASFSLSAEKRAAILGTARFSGLGTNSPDMNVRAGLEKLEKILAAPFTPGVLLTAAIDAGLPNPVEFLETVLAQSEQHLRAEFGEGYWVDHWTYILDLVDSYLAVYPDKKAALLFDSEPLPFYDSPEVVLPRRERYVLSGGKPRQLNALRKDPEKATLIAARGENGYWARAKNGQGEPFRLNLFGKLSLLAALKFATRDPFGMGIEMEAGRPGWYDALNGLPGLFGSSMPETYELLRLVDFLLGSLAESPRETDLPREAADLLDAIRAQSASKTDDLSRWNALSDAREAYRTATRLGFDGETIRLDAATLTELLRGMQASLLDGIRRAAALTDNVPPTYLACEPVEYDILDETDSAGRCYIAVKSFKPVPLPAFLEGPVRQMKVLPTEEAAKLHQAVRASDLFDDKLGMYRVNASLDDQPHDIGRARAFSPGWLENGSIWLHMSYKYLLELLRAGLYEQFFAELPSNLVPFMDPAVYGRSPLENSSFIVSSAHPDESLHGAGFVARLSGSTAEFLSMWQLMMSGIQPFVVQNGELKLTLQPILPGAWFDADGNLSFRLLGKTDVTYHNPSRRDTFSGLEAEKTVLHLASGEIVEFPGGIVPAPYAQMVREGQVVSINVYL
jgi:hypothetical protein